MSSHIAAGSCVSGDTLVKCVTKYFFKRADVQILVIKCIDERGWCRDLKTWNRMKAFYLYSLIEPDEYYIMRVLDEGQTPDRKFSSADYEHWDYTLRETNQEFPLYNSISFDTHLKSYEHGESFNLIGVLIDVVHLSQEQFFLPVQGYIMILEDRYGQRFNVLFWHNKSTNPELKCLRSERGDTVLIMDARLKGDLDMTGFSVTTLNEPIIESDCVDEEIRNRLRDDYFDRS